MNVAIIAYCDWVPALVAFDYVIAVDSGIVPVAKAGVVCDCWLGDFDSVDDQTTYARFAKQIVALPREKDETDTEVALAFAQQIGASEVTLFTTHAGRFDHQYAQLLLGAQWSQKMALQICSQNNTVRFLTPGDHSIVKTHEYLSLFAWQAPVTALTLTGVAYPLAQATLLPTSPLAISNEITGAKASVQFTSGQLLLIQSCDATGDCATQK